MLNRCDGATFRRTIGMVLTATLLASLLGLLLAEEANAAAVSTTVASNDSDYPGGLTRAEFMWCAKPTRGPLCNSAYRDLARWAENHALNCQNEDVTCTNGDEANAFQHCLWSATLKLYHGERTARGFLTRHESNSYNGNQQSIDDADRDWRNNELGFQVAREGAVDMYMDRNLTKKDVVLSRCIRLADEERLDYLPG